MLYNAYELQRAALNGAAAWASVGAEMLSSPAIPANQYGLAPVLASALDVFAHAAAPRGKPAFDIETVTVNGKVHGVVEAIMLHRPFVNLLRFTHDGLAADAPKVLIVAPMSGHFATLLRGTVARMLENSIVYITDWADAKMVPEDAGHFDLDDYIDHVIEFLEFIGPDTHLIAVCQPSVPALAATAVMAGHDNPARPASLTMMGGPIDTRESPTSVNNMAMQRPLGWFENFVISRVPYMYPGAGRRVYPGFLQLASFMSMNLSSHMMSHYGMFKHMVEGDEDGAGATKAFYEEYRSVCDLPAEFYIQTVENVFQLHSLPKGEFIHRGETIDLGAIRDTALLAIEGERDDISGIGQTKAALHLATGLAEERKQYFLALGAGHYGIFNGSKWRTEIAPVIEKWIAQHRRTPLKIVA